MAPKPGYKLSAETRRKQSIAAQRKWREFRDAERDSPKPTHKKCSVCKEMKPLTEYVHRRVWRQSTREYIWRPVGQCRECKNEWLRQYYHSMTEDEKRERNLKARKKVAVDAETSPLVSTGPFIKWWDSLSVKPTTEQLGEAMMRAVIRARQQGKMRLYIVYNICALAGRPEIAGILYPDY